MSPKGVEFVSSELTRGPWDPDSQHAGPPAALIARELERHPTAGEAGRSARITYEILRPVPIAPLRVESRCVRPGRSVELLAADAARPRRRAAGPRRRLAARRAADVELARPELPRAAPREPPPGAAAAEEKPFFDTGGTSATTRRWSTGSSPARFLELGPATVWMRMRHPLVAGEEPTPLQRVLTAADSGNGVSATLDLARYIFINVDLSVHLHRLPAGEWVCLDAITVPEPNGVGLADTALHDERGPIGRALQTLLVRER